MLYFTRARKQVKSLFTPRDVTRWGVRLRGLMPSHVARDCFEARRFTPGAPNRFSETCSWRSVLRSPLMLGIACVLAGAGPAQCQDNGSESKEFLGNGAEITVMVRDAEGQPISAPANVKLYREGSIPSGEGATSQGRLQFVVTNLGEFTVTVQLPGYQSAQKDVSVREPVRTQVDVYLRRERVGENIVGVPGKPVLAPKARESFDKGLRALSEDKLRDAEKFVGDAARLAPGHPDVLYVQGVLYLKQRNWEQAQSALEKATQVDPNHAPAFAALGMALEDQRKYDAAIIPLEKSLSLDAGVGFEAHWALAKAYYQSTRYEEALKSAQAALAESKGKAPEIALLVAQALTAVGQYEEAAQTLRAFLREHGDRPEAGKARRWLDGLRSSGKIGAE
jgi:Tetratricopeptide repeat